MKTMIVDNNLDNIKVYDSAGIDRIFLDLEINDKIERQGHLDTVISNHTLSDIKKIKPILQNSKLLVRVNPLYNKSTLEIETAIDFGADIIMLPMFENACEVNTFINIVNNRAKVCLLLETSQALARIEEILDVSGIDEIHIGLNDLHLSLGLDFMFELMSGGILEYLSQKIKAKNIPFGIGGIAKIEDGLISGEIIMKEHIRLGSSMVILSRTFKEGILENPSLLRKELIKLQHCELQAMQAEKSELEDNKKLLMHIVNRIVKNKKNLYV